MTTITGNTNKKIRSNPKIYTAIVFVFSTDISSLTTSSCLMSSGQCDLVGVIELPSLSYIAGLCKMHYHYFIYMCLLFRVI